MKALSMFASLIVIVLWIGSMASAQVAPNSFGWQCGPSKNTNCPNVRAPQNQLPSDLPYTLRMHDTQTWWSQLETSNGGYDNGAIGYLDGYIDSIAKLESQGQPHYVIFTFSHVPCWASGSGTGCPNTAPPNSQNSGAFTSFVEWLATHQTAGGNIVGQYVQAYEMWNEWNGYSTANGGAYTYWSGSSQQLHDMLQPAAAYLKTLIPRPVIIMPSTTPLAKLSYQSDFSNWLGLDNFSDVVNWHLYLSNLGSGPASNTPEVQWAYGQTFLNLQNANSSWKGKPFVDSETNFTGQTLGYICPSSYDANDCTGQIARWQLMHVFNGGAGLFWYYGNQTIGNCNGNCTPPNPTSYDTAYNTLSGYLNGATNLTPCSITKVPKGAQTYDVWSCSFTEGSGGNGNQLAAFVWACLENSSHVCGPTPSTSTVNISLTNPPYVDYRDLTDTTVHNISGTQQVTIGALPILVEE